MTSLLLLNNFYPVISYRQVLKKKIKQKNRKRRIIEYGSVTRYGPRTSCQRKGLRAFSDTLVETCN